MAERILSHLNRTIGDRSNSLRTVVPSIIVKRLNLTESDILEWVEKKGDIIVKKL